MAKLIDKMFNRVIEGELSDLSEKDAQEIGKVVSGGTKLYKHTLNDSEAGYLFSFITTFKDPLDFSSLNTYKKINDFLETIIILSFKDDNNGSNIYWDNINNMFANTSQYLLQEQTVIISLVDIDDWDLLATTDTVTPL